MPATEISPDVESTERARTIPGIDSNVLLTVILGLLTAVSILLLIYQVDRSFQRKIEAVEVWSDYQVKVVKATTEEDPNLRAQYSEEREVLRQHAEDLKRNSLNARYVVKLSAYSCALLLLGTTISFLSFLVRVRYLAYVGILVAVLGVAVALKSVL